MKNEKNFESENLTQNDCNRKNVEAIKKFIITALLMMFVVPILFSIYLVVRVNNIDERIENLIMDMRKDYAFAATDSDAERLVKSDLDNDALDDIEKSDKDNNELLSNSFASEEGITNGPDTPAVSNGKKVYLTFDDGPNKYTDELLDILKEKNVKATFFVVYNADESTWHDYKRIIDEGHTLGMHSYTHIYDEIYASKEAFMSDVSKLHTFLYEQTGIDCQYYRFPGGSSNTVSDVDIQLLISYLNNNGITYFDWNALSGDALTNSMSPEELNETILQYVRANEGDSIVLMHDLSTNHATVDSISELVDTLRAEGYEICPIDETTIPIQHVKYNSGD